MTNGILRPWNRHTSAFRVPKLAKAESDWLAYRDFQEELIYDFLEPLAGRAPFSSATSHSPRAYYRFHAGTPILLPKKWKKKNNPSFPLLSSLFFTLLSPSFLHLRCHSLETPRGLLNGLESWASPTLFFSTQAAV